MRDWYKVRDLIAKLSQCPPDADVLLTTGIFDVKAACEETFGWPPGLSTLGANCVRWDEGDSYIYILHSTEPDVQTDA